MPIRLQALASVGLLWCASACLYADEIRIEDGSTTLNANLLIAADRSLKDGVILMLHGTLGHKDMEIIETLQSVYEEYDYSSLAINLSLNIDDRHGFYPCDLPHTHEYNDALREIDLWLAWLKGEGVGEIVLLGHSRGANQIANYLLTHKNDIRSAILIAPSASGGRLSKIQADNLKIAASSEWLEDVDFLHCKNTKVLGSSYASYYQSVEQGDTPQLLTVLTTPTLVFSGSHDTTVTGLPEKMKSVTNDLISYVEIDGADHFFRDLFAYDVVESSIVFMESLQSIKPAVSMKRDSRSSAQYNRPIVVFVSQQGCQFCELLRTRVLQPMLRAGEFNARAIVREVSLDDGFLMLDFAGESVRGSLFARHYHSEMTPTLLFLDAYGQEVANRIVGISNIEYYGFYLDKAITAATKVIAAAESVKKQ